MNDTALQKLKDTDAEADELVSAARALACSSDAQDHAGLRTALGKAALLEALEDKNEDGDFEEPLAVEMVLDDLAHNDCDSARQLISEPTQDVIFTSDGMRVEALIKACAAVRPATPEVIAFWDKFCKELDGYTPVTIRAILDNASDPALELFERKMTTDEHAGIYKCGWILNSVLPRRNGVALLQCCGRLLRGKLADELKPVMVDGLFDYRPEEWYHPERRVTPPDREQASPPAKAELAKIGDYALKSVELTDQQKEKVEQVLSELQAQ